MIEYYIQYIDCNDISFVSVHNQLVNNIYINEWKHNTIHNIIDECYKIINSFIPFIIFISTTNSDHAIDNLKNEIINIRKNKLINDVKLVEYKNIIKNFIDTNDIEFNNYDVVNKNEIKCCLII